MEGTKQILHKLFGIHWMEYYTTIMAVFYILDY